MFFLRMWLLLWMTQMGLTSDCKTLKQSSFSPDSSSKRCDCNCGAKNQGNFILSYCSSVLDEYQVWHLMTGVNKELQKIGFECCASLPDSFEKNRHSSIAHFLLKFWTSQAFQNMCFMLNARSVVSQRSGLIPICNFSWYTHILYLVTAQRWRVLVWGAKLWLALGQWAILYWQVCESAVTS